MVHDQEVEIREIAGIEESEGVYVFIVETLFGGMRSRDSWIGQTVVVRETEP